MVKTRLNGEVAVYGAPPLTFRTINWRLASSPPVTLVYCEPEKGLPVSFFGAWSGLSLSDQVDPGPLQHQIPDSTRVEAFPSLSYAPLAGLESTLVFHDESTGFCRGILFRYRNGRTRVIGQCRLHVIRQ